MSKITYTFCPVCKDHIDESGFRINEPAPSSEIYEDRGYKFCPECISDAKDVMFEEKIPLSESLLNLITVEAYRNDRLVITAARKEEARYNAASDNLFEKLGEIMKPVSEEQFAGIMH